MSTSMAFAFRALRSPSATNKLLQLLAASLLLLGAAAHVHAAGDPFNPGAGASSSNSGMPDDDDDDGKSWQEAKSEIPPQPQAANLVSFYVSPTATMNFFVDVNSISAGSDGVVRYTLVSKSQGGAENVSYEGIRCQTYESKSYAFGQKDGSWSRARLSGWKQISESSGNRQHAALAKDFLCQDGMIAGKVEDIRSRLRSNRPIKPGS
ncbi:CNP1-like family protein [Collimonas fungivorans]|uniref:CNP1-like family protein n=1 Tax=Collimonas fungivorans TaxID=158899 RepID=UPI0026E9B781|nr:CNP1-like family protein [Collimonas fungivorans]